MSVKALILLVAGTVLAGATIADAAVAIAAGAVLLAAWLANSRVSRFTAGAAAVAVAGAGLATLFEGDLDPDTVTSAFADVRPVAAQLGALGAVLLLGAAAAAGLEGADRPPASDRPRDRDQLDHETTALAIPPGWPAFAAAAFVIRLLGAPEVLSSAQQSLSDNIDAGIGLLLGAPGAAEPTTYLMPLPATLVAFAPLPATLLLAVVGTLTVLGCALLGARLFDRRIGLLAGWMAALLPSMWGQQLPEALAALAVVCTLTLAQPSTLTRPRAVAVGVTIALAAYSRPECLVLLPVVMVWWAADRRSLRQFAAPALLALLVAFGPWLSWAHGETGSWVPTTSLGPTVAAGSSAAIDGTLTGAADPALAPQPESDEAEVDRRARTAVRARAGDHLAPDLIVRRVLRGWDLWGYGSADSARRARGLPLPGGPIGVLVEVAALGLALLGAWTARGRWRVVLPLLIIPVLFTVETALTFGDRGLRGWVAPVVAVLAAVGLRVLLGRRDRDRSGQASMRAS